MKYAYCGRTRAHAPHQYVSMLDGYTCSGEVKYDKPQHLDDMLPPPEVDMVNHPPHYGAHPSGVECITITEHMNFNVGNAVKYLWRADLKDGLEDLKKAEWYVKREIERRERDLG